MILMHDMLNKIWLLTLLTTNSRYCCAMSSTRLSMALYSFKISIIIYLTWHYIDRYQ
jgi:hypothetical protein